MTSVSDIDNRIWLSWSDGIICRGRYFSIAATISRNLQSPRNRSRDMPARVPAHNARRRPEVAINRGYAKHDFIAVFLTRDRERERENERERL